MNVTCNGQPRDVSEETTVSDLLAELGLDPRRVAVEINRELVPRSTHRDHQLHEGDRLEVVTLVGGG